MADAKRKVVAILSKDEDLVACKKEMEKLFETSKVPADFLFKRLNALKKAYENDMDVLWQKFGKLLCEKGYIPEYVHDRDAIGYSEEEDTVYWRKFGKVESSSGMPDGLRTLLESLMKRE